MSVTAVMKTDAGMNGVQTFASPDLFGRNFLRQMWLNLPLKA